MAGVVGWPAQAEKAQAEQFRNAELPFIVYNIPSLVRRRASAEVPRTPWHTLPRTLTHDMHPRSTCAAGMLTQEEVRRKWSNDYLSQQLSRKFGVETSHDNHFMYYNKGMARQKLVGCGQPRHPVRWLRPVLTVCS